MRTWSILLRGEPIGRLATIITPAAYWPPPSMSCEATERRPPLVSNQFQPLGATFSQQGTETSPSARHVVVLLAHVRGHYALDQRKPTTAITTNTVTTNRP